MKTKFIIVVIIGVLLVGLAFLFRGNLPKSFHQTITKTSNLSNESFSGLKINQDIKSDSFTSKFGKMTTQSRDVENYNYFKISKSLEIATSKKDMIKRINVTGSNHETAKGIKIGNNKTALILAYGENYYQRSEQGLAIVGYVDKKNNTSLEFWLKGNKIKFYRLDDSSMK